jgi:hypothetical protein
MDCETSTPRPSMHPPGPIRAAIHLVSSEKSDHYTIILLIAGKISTSAEIPG